MRKVAMYELNEYLETCGHFFMIRYSEESSTAQKMSAPKETCRLYVGAAGPATLSLYPERMAFLYLGDTMTGKCMDSGDILSADRVDSGDTLNGECENPGDIKNGNRVEEPVTWTIAEDGVKEADATAFLRAHRIPFRVNCLNASTKKAEKYLGSCGRAYLGERGLVAISRYHFNKNWSDSFFVDGYLAPRCMKERAESDRYVKSFSIITRIAPDKPLDYLRAELEAADEKVMNSEAADNPVMDSEAADKITTINMEDFLQTLPTEITLRDVSDVLLYSESEANRQENFVTLNYGKSLSDEYSHIASCTHRSDDHENALNLSGFFKENIRLYLGYSVTGAMTVPCRVRIYGSKRELDIPWATDLQNTYLIFRDKGAGTYAFERIPVTRREDGTYSFDPMAVLETHGISLHMQTKAECRKLTNHLERLYQKISAAPCGYRFSSVVRYSMYTSNVYGGSEYLNGCRLCGKPILRIGCGPTDFDSGESPLSKDYWMPYYFSDLFRWNGDISAEHLLEDGKQMMELYSVYFVLEDGNLWIGHMPESRDRYTIRFSRDGEVIRELDVTEWTWEERAKALVEMLG